MVEYGKCPYHGKFKLVEWEDWQCPKCAKEIMDFSAWRTGKKKSPETGMNLMRRAGMRL